MTGFKGKGKLPKYPSPRLHFYNTANDYLYFGAWNRHLGFQAFFFEAENVSDVLLLKLELSYV